MPSPFPGMDPYLEGPLWPDVHHELASAIRRQLTPRLGPGYVARIAVRLVKDAEPEEEIGIMYPDVAVLRDPREADDPAFPAVSIRLVTVEVRSVATGRLDTAVEIVSPVNKRGEGLREYRRKRERLRTAKVHLLEIDLLRRGERVIPGRRVPNCDYLVGLTRAREGVTELWPLVLRDPLPIVPVPLRKGDDDVPLSLEPALIEVYKAAAYHKSIDYSQPPQPPELSPEDAAWVRQVTESTSQ
jgi:hypothetical protein